MLAEKRHRHYPKPHAGQDRVVPNRRRSGRSLSRPRAFSSPSLFGIHAAPVCGNQALHRALSRQRAGPPLACATSVASPSTSTSRRTSWGLAWRKSRTTWSPNWASWPRVRPTSFPAPCLQDNPAWPESLVAAARAGRYPQRPFLVMQPLALSRTQDDKGNVRWTLFGASHEPASVVFWRGFAETDEERFLRLVAWASGDEPPPRDALRVFGSAAELPGFARARLWREPEPAGQVHTLFTLQPFGTLPDSLQRAFLDGKLRILPTPASQVFCGHTGYRKLAAALPRASQIPLLHLFSHVQEGYTLRIPQSGWLDEHDPSQARPAGSHRIARHITRTHRWQRTPRDQALVGDGAFTDTVTVALFSTNPDDLGLYGKPMARNSQIWTHDYELLLDGPRASKAELEYAAELLDRGGRFGYRIYYPPMRVGTRELFWHLPLLARLNPGSGKPEIYVDTLRLGTCHRRSDRAHRRAPASCSRPISSIVPAIAKPPACLRASPVSSATPPRRTCASCSIFASISRAPCLPRSPARCFGSQRTPPSTRGWPSCHSWRAIKRPRPVCSTICARTSRPRPGWARRSPSQTPQPAGLRRRSGGPSRPWPKENIGTRKPPTGW